MATKTPTVLYMEDEDADVLFMYLAFESEGLKTALQTVRDGRAAIKYLSGEGPYAERGKYPLPKVLLLDLNLPEMNGFDVLKWVRSHASYRTLPVIIFSSSSRPEDRSKARKLGANEFWAKPNSGYLFTKVVKKLRAKWL